MKAIHNDVAAVGDLFQSSSYNLFSMCTQVYKSVIQVQARAALRAAHFTERLYRKIFAVYSSGYQFLHKFVHKSTSG